MTAARRLVRVLEEDPDLGEGLSDEQRGLALASLVAAVTVLDKGSWKPPFDPDRRSRYSGLLILGGLMTRTVHIDSVRFMELIGPEDILRPWQPPVPEPRFRTEARWEVVQPTTVALLDERFLARAGQWPSVIDALLGRVMNRSRSLAFHLAVCHITRVDMRLLLALWHLAGRWGRVRPDGVLLTLPLTHERLAQIVGARRPTVTTALGDLSRQGLLERRGHSWLLREAPPESLHRLRAQTHS